MKKSFYVFSSLLVLALVCSCSEDLGKDQDGIVASHNELSLEEAVRYYQRGNGRY